MQRLECRKLDRGLTRLLHSELHWLDVPQRVQFKRGVNSSSASAGQGHSRLDKAGVLSTWQMSVSERRWLLEAPLQH